MRTVVHLAEQQVPPESAELLRRLRAGEEIVIQGESDCFRLTRISKNPTLGEFLEDSGVLASLRNLDGSFGEDVQAGIDLHRHEHVSCEWD